MKIDEIIIHVGMHKTGTTSIQRTLNKHLEDSRFIYVKLAVPNHSRQIFTLFEEKNHPSINKIKNQEIEKVNIKTKNRLIENFKKSKDKKYIISGESIRGMSLNALINFKSFLKQYFHKITVVAYIRPPKAYMESAFQQIIKDGTTNFNIETVYPNYRKFKYFFKVFGKENVKLWKFDPEHFPNNSVVLDFCQRLGIDMKLKHIITHNESLSKEALSLLYIYRKFGPTYKKNPISRAENRHLIERLSNIKGHKVKFGPKLIKPILNKYKKDIEWMESILDRPLKEHISLSKYNIREEKDLLSVSNESIDKLIELIGKDELTKDMKVSTLEDIAALVHLLHTPIDKQTIMQYWADANIPEEIKILTNSWKNKNKNFKHIIFNKKDASNFIKEHFSEEIYSAFLSIKLPAMEADVFRVAYILKNGGLYVDCATKCISQLDNNLISSSKLTLMRKDHGGIWNGFIYAKEANNNVLQKIWKEIEVALITRKEGKILQLTGPKLFEKIVNTNLNDTNIFTQNRIKHTFSLVKALKHRGAVHWSRMQNIEPLYYDNFYYKPKNNYHKELKSKKIIIHIGQHVTEVQYIHKVLNFLEKEYSDFLYPKLYCTNFNHDKIAHILSSVDNREIDILFEKFYLEILESTKNTIVISSELFSSFNAINFNKQKVTRVWKRLNQLIEPFGEKNIIYYIREQAESIEYRFNRLIQGTMCLSVINPGFMMHNPNLDYSLFYCALQKYFPDSVISQKIYANSLLSPKEIYYDFFNNSNFKNTVEWEGNEKSEDTIKSILLAKILLKINSTELKKADKMTLKNIFLRKLPNIGDFTFLTQGNIQKIRKRFASSNKEANIKFINNLTSSSNIKLEDYLLDKKAVRDIILNYFPQYMENGIDNIEQLFTIILKNNF